MSRGARAIGTLSFGFDVERTAETDRLERALPKACDVTSSASAPNVIDTADVYSTGGSVRSSVSSVVGGPVQ